MIDKMLNKLLKGKQKVTFTLTNNQGMEVKVILEGDGRCCKDIRDRIVWGWPSEGWTQGSLVREKIGE